MKNKQDEIEQIRSTFATRLDTLEHLLTRAESVFGEDASFLQGRLAPDMFPLGTQFAFTCNQPRNFARWCEGSGPDNLNGDVGTSEQAHIIIQDTRSRLLAADAHDAKLDDEVRLELRPGLFLNLTGRGYVHDFLMPNFYFHFVTAYAILRKDGMDLGKRDYMLHLSPFLQQE